MREYRKEAKFKNNPTPTMTVGELREKLSEYPDDMPVVAEWEGTINSFCPKGFEIKKEEFYQEPTLEICVDDMMNT